jgi:hypothetical protein
MANLRGVADLTNASRILQMAMTFAASGALFLFTIWRLRKMADPHEYFPPAVVMAVLVSYHLNLYDLTLLLLPVVALVAFGDRSIPTQLCLGAFFLFPVFVVFDIVLSFVVVEFALLLLTSKNRRGESTVPYSLLSNQQG